MNLTDGGSQSLKKNNEQSLLLRGGKMTNGGNIIAIYHPTLPIHFFGLNLFALEDSTSRFCPSSHFVSVYECV